MLDSPKKANLFIVKLIASIVVIVIAVATYLICQFAIGSEKLGFPGAFILPIVAGFGFGVVSLIFGVINKSTSDLCFGTLWFIVGVVFLLWALKVYWYVNLIIAIALLAIGFLLAFVMRAKSLVIKFDNAEHEQKKLEKEENNN